MRMRVCKSSGLPVEGAVSVQTTMVDHWGPAYGDLEYLRRLESNYWGAGTNHRTLENGVRVRDLRRQVEVIDGVDTLDDLARFAAEHGELVVSYDEDSWPEYPWEVEIYDTWRE